MQWFTFSPAKIARSTVPKDLLNSYNAAKKINITFDQQRKELFWKVLNTHFGSILCIMTM